MPRTQSRYRIYGGPLNYRNAIFGPQSSDSDNESNTPQLLNRIFEVKSSVLVPMARVGIYLAVKNLILPGQHVAMSPYTIADVVNMVIAAGGKPLFIDVEPDTGNMDPEQLKQRITPNTGLILVTHLHGITAQIEEILGLSRKWGLPVVEDTAQALGARTETGCVGTLSTCGVFSFGTYKNINSFFGGAVVTQDSQLAEIIRKEMQAWPSFDQNRLRQKIKQSALIDILGWEPLFSATFSRLFRYGFLNDVPWINRMTAIELDTSRKDELPDWYQAQMSMRQTRLLPNQFDNLDHHTQSRISKAEIYDQRIQGSQNILKPPRPSGARNVYTYYPLQVKNRTHFLKWMMHFHRDIAPQHLKNCASLPSFREFASDCPVADRVAREVVLLPTYPSYRDDQVYENCQIIRWYQQSGCPDYSPRLESRRFLG